MELQIKIVRFTGNEVADEFYDMIVDSAKKAVALVGSSPEKLEALRIEVSSLLADIKNLQDKQRFERNNRR